MTNVTQIFVVEDEPLILDDLCATLEELGYEISGSASEAEEALAKLGEASTDLILLDISIEGARDGIDLAHQVNADLNIPFIFLTAFYDEKTLKRARATQPAGYIVKPWNENNLKANIEVALAKSIGEKKQEQKKPESFFVKHKGDMIAVKPEDIVYAESYDNYTYIITEQEKYLISHTLKSVEEKLNPLGFLRVHKSYLVNMMKVELVSDGVIFIQQYEIPVGRTYKTNLLKRIKLL